MSTIIAGLSQLIYNNVFFEQCMTIQDNLLSCGFQLCIMNFNFCNTYFYECICVYFVTLAVVKLVAALLPPPPNSASITGVPPCPVLIVVILINNPFL